MHVTRCMYVQTYVIQITLHLHLQQLFLVCMLTQPEPEACCHNSQIATGSVIHNSTCLLTPFWVLAQIL